MNQPSTPNGRPVFKRVEQSSKAHLTGVGHPPLTRTRTPKLHTARRCEQRANRELTASRSITKDQLAPCLKHKEKLFSPLNQSKVLQKNKTQTLQPPEGLGVKTKKSGISQSPKRKKMQTAFFDNFIANQIFNTPERKHYRQPERINPDKLPVSIEDSNSKDTNGLGRSFWNKKDRNNEEGQKAQRNNKSVKVIERNGTKAPKLQSKEEQKQKEEPKAFFTPQNKLIQDNKNENCMSVGQESKVEPILNLLLIDSKHTRELIKKVREGADEGELLLELALKENNLYDLRHILEGEGRPQYTKRKSLGGGSAKLPQRSNKKK